MMRIGQLADATGTGVETIRYYEREGLLEHPQRTASGYREFGPDAAARLRFIARARSLGFTLAEIRELLYLRTSARSTRADVRRVAADHLERIRTRIAALQNLEATLASLIERCHGNGQAAECPILEAFEELP